MDTDLMLTIGLVLIALAIPSLLAAWAETRAPRLGAVMLLAAAILIVLALTQKPGGYAFADIPGVMVGVFGRLVK